MNSRMRRVRSGGWSVTPAGQRSQAISPLPCGPVGEIRIWERSGHVANTRAALDTLCQLSPPLLFAARGRFTCGVLLSIPMHALWSPVQNASAAPLRVSVIRNSPRDTERSMRRTSTITPTDRPAINSDTPGPRPDAYPRTAAVQNASSAAVSKEASQNSVTCSPSTCQIWMALRVKSRIVPVRSATP